MADVSSSVRNDMINAAVNALYKNVGSERIDASKAAKRVLDTSNHDGKVDKQELKDALENDRVVLSLREVQDGSYHRVHNAREVADDVAERMDRADGRDDDYIDFTSKNGSGLFERMDALWGNIKNGIFKNDFVTALANGNLVIGRQIRSRASAKERDLTIVELHQNSSGPRIVMGQ
ncbi:MAG: hypothetical protein HY692_03960 [Cyanobacteria bacterium NC_groundwater_1444_Ag_S-0.65um_54_12]|nr:hypothetical protein [Cyanobacteria bacterium NC_groundwater_1444_Ag_S-0.65um_54_12]